VEEGGKMLRTTKSKPKNTNSGIDRLGLFQKSRKTTGRTGGLKIRKGK